MRTYEYTFSTTIEFSGEVREHSFVLRCLPRRGEGVAIVQENLDIEPGRGYARQRDSFGNELAVGCIRAAHDRISYRSSGIVRIDLAQSAAATAQRAASGMPANPHPLFRYASPLAASDESMRRWAEESGFGAKAFSDDGAGALAAFAAMGSAIHDFMAYEPGATTVSTTAAQAFAERRGVCQDFAHIMIALLRDAGVAARYVSGLAVGEGTTHAWAQAFIDGAWHGYDPTRNTAVDEGYLPLAVGRDWSDCPVERGSFLGLVDQTQTVFMTMRECE